MQTLALTEANVLQALTVDDALQAMLALVRVTATEEVAIESAVGRTLACDVVSTVTIPPWPNAGMDGYAVRRADVVGASRTAPRTLTVIATIQAGSALRPEITAGIAARIMTGAPMPPGADAVVRVEDSDRGETVVCLSNDRDVIGESGNVRAAGLDVRAGECVAHAGDLITAARLGVLASVGTARVQVHARPRVHILSGGNELVGVEEFARVERGEAIVSSSSYALPAVLRETGAEVVLWPLLRDELDDVVVAMRRALESGCDLLVTTGGVSVGAFDFVREAIGTLGGTTVVPRVRIRPGGPLAAGNIGDVVWIGLPGNPVSTLVTAELFVRPVIRRMSGQTRVHPRRVRVVLGEAVSTPARLTYFLRTQLTTSEEGALVATLTGLQGSNLLTSMARADALIQVEGPAAHTPAGTVVPAVLLDGALLCENTEST